MEGMSGTGRKRSRTKRMSKIYYVDSEKDDSASIQALLDTCAGEEAEIIFRQGTYYLDKGLVLTKEHRNLILRGEGEVRLNGGKQLKNWTRAEGTPAAERFDTDARAHIYVCDLVREKILPRGGKAPGGEDVKEFTEVSPARPDPPTRRCSLTRSL